MRALALAALFLVATSVHAQSEARRAGKAVGEFSAGFGEAVGDGIQRGFEDLQPEWVTVAPRTRAECLKVTGGVVNPQFVRCRNGWQEYVQYTASGRKRVLQERAIPISLK